MKKEAFHGNRNRSAVPRRNHRAVRRSGQGVGSRLWRGTPRRLFHWAAQTDAGVKVVDVWASKEQMQRFVEEQVAPAGRDAGLPEPELTFIDVHAYMVGR